MNQNGRWAPPSRVATMLVEAGEIGEVVAVTHLLDRDFRFTVGTHDDDFQHPVIYDHLIHWIDITRCWLGSKQPLAARARLYRVPNQPAESASPWGGLARVRVPRRIQCARPCRRLLDDVEASSSFWVYGTQGTIRGVVSATLTPGPEFVELEREGVVRRFSLKGSWQAHGFAGAMAELLNAIAEDREPFNSGRHDLRSLEMTLAACRSADEDSRRVLLDELSSG